MIELRRLAPPRRWVSVLGRAGCGWLLVFSAALCGCDYLKLDKLQPTKKQLTPTPTPAPKPLIPAAKPPPLRLIQLSLSPPLKTADCYISLQPAVGQVPPILQVTSSAEGKSETYPSVYLRAVAPSGDLRTILNQALSARIFVERTLGGPVLENPDAEPAQVVIKGFDADHVAGQISATLVDHGSGERTTVTGQFEGKVR